MALLPPLSLPCCAAIGPLRYEEEVSVVLLAATTAEVDESSWREGVNRSGAK